MHIKELIIDGFKSYANRTVITGWDPAFNAITGFNGTGKSNVLDSICFVLGISNLSQVRVQALQELIYKQGQARVNRASVTIVFDNRETSKSPIGYESCTEITITRQIMMGGRGKYLINGHTAQLQRVQNLFQSVGLNVNNPHFLIMQGRITKVCNMKPLETLGMIEEAAGTKMFETKKQAAQKTILKKQQKVDEIQRIMEEEILPVLEQLRGEKQNFHKYNANKQEIEVLQRLFDALTYYQATEKQAAIEKENEANASAVQQLQAEMESIQANKESKMKQVEELKLRREKEFSSNKEYLALETKGNEFSKELVQRDQQWKNHKSTLADQEKEMKTAEKNIDAMKKAVDAKTKEVAAAEEKFQAISTEHKRLTEDINHIKSAQLGINVSSEETKEGESSSSGGLAGQLMSHQKALTEEEGKIKSSTTKLKHCTQQLKEQEKKLKEAEKSGDSTVKNMKEKEELIAKLTAQLSSIHVDTPMKNKLESQVSALKDELNQMKYEHDTLEITLSSRLKFEYSTKGNGLNDTKVKGLVANLIRLPNTSYTTAVEIIAGGKMYNVVVDTEETGKTLLEKGGLKKRVTIIPLNKIQSRGLPAAAVKKAQELAGAAAGGEVKVATEVVEYDDELKSAMSYIFGTSFIVSDSTLASKITFHPEVRTRCVTLDGDVYDPSGTLEGGSLPSGPSVLTQLMKLNQLNEVMAKKSNDLKELTKKLTELQTAEKTAADCTKKLDILKIELKSIQERQSQSEYFSLSQSCIALRTEVETLNTFISGSDERKKDLKSRIKQVEDMLKDFEGERAKSQEKMEARLQALTKELTASNKKLTDQQKKVSMGKIELDELHKELATAESALKKLSEEMQATQGAISEAESLVTEKRAQFDAFEASMKEAKKKFHDLDVNLAKLTKEVANFNKTTDEMTLEIKKTQAAITRAQTERTECVKFQHRFEKEHDWIKTEKSKFGVVGGDYDFSQSKDTGKRLAELQAEQEALRKKINPKVMGQFEKAETEAAELNKKRAIILEDKAQIEHVIAELDIEKTKTLETTWHTVSDSFGMIFSTLLPGVHAKLVPADGAKSVMDGLDIKVSFGGIEKESLSELSGGQRSLLALSLILALLKFKPAPMYILDEIDAALDLSHTQNIGQVLKKHFSESQFIVVSLKEGMFNNANVLFRTKFVDGVSNVIRTTLQERQKGIKA